MGEHELAPLWTRLDEQGKDIQKVAVQAELNRLTLTSHVEEFRKMNREQSGAHHELMKTMDLIGLDVKTVMNDFHERRGAKQITRWLIPVLISAIAILLAYVKFGP